MPQVSGKAASLEKVGRSRISSTFFTPESAWAKVVASFCRGRISVRYIPPT